MSVAHEINYPFLQWSDDAPQRWTADDVLAMPEDDKRYEVVDGSLIVNPPPGMFHQIGSRRLANLIEAAAQDAGREVVVVEAVGLRLRDGQMLIPDILVARPDMLAGDGKLANPADVLLAIELVSPGSSTRDRTEKPYLYAEAGIPNFWRIELSHFRGRAEPLPVLFAYTLADHEYRLTQRTGAGTVAELDQPFPVKLDTATLLPS